MTHATRGTESPCTKRWRARLAEYDMARTTGASHPKPRRSQRPLRRRDVAHSLRVLGNVCERDGNANGARWVREMVARVEMGEVLA